MALRAPGGGAGGDGAAGKLGAATGAVAALFPTVLKEPFLGRNLRDVAAGSETLAGVGEEAFVFVCNMFEGSPGDELGFLTQRGGVELGSGSGGVELHAPTDFVGHPVADAREASLVENKGLEAGAGSFFEEELNESEGEAAVEDFGGQGGPRLGVFVEVGAAELAVVVVDESQVGEPDEEVVVFVRLVVSRGDGEAAGHAEMDFEGEDLVFLLEGKEEPLAVGAAGNHLGSGERGLDGDGGGVAVDSGLGMSFDGNDLFP